MSMIMLKDVSMEYKVLNKNEGIKGAFRDLFSRDYRNVKAVSNININVDKGEIVAFVGPNGAGKSTTIKMLTGVLQPSSGTIRVNGYNPVKNRLDYLRGIGVVFGQRTQLWWDLPVIESFKVVKEIYKISDQSYNENMHLYSNLVNLDDLLLTPVRYLSLGQRMLCDILLSFLHNPKVIFLDEPTIGLDISVKEKFREIIRELNKLKNTTIILTTHDIGDIEALCERIIIIDKGHIIYDDQLQKINSIYGNHNIIKIYTEKYQPAKEITSKLNGFFTNSKSITCENQVDGSIKIVVKQDLPYIEVLDFLIKNYKIKDVSIEKIDTESIIKGIYERKIINALHSNN